MATIRGLETERRKDGESDVREISSEKLRLPEELRTAEVLSEVQAALEFAQEILETVLEWLPTLPAEARIRLGIALAGKLERVDIS